MYPRTEIKFFQDRDRLLRLASERRDCVSVCMFNRSLGFARCVTSDTTCAACTYW